MNSTANFIGGYDVPTIAMWVAGALAAIFVFFIVFDSFRRSHRRMRRRIRAETRGKEATTFTYAVRVVAESLTSDATRQRRRKAVRTRNAGK